MNYENFCFWLQGYFELNVGNKYLNYNQVESIRNHLNLAKEIENNKSHQFITWLSGYIDYFESCININRQAEPLGIALQEIQVEMISDRLNECFKHDIDPKYNKLNVKEKLDNMHKPLNVPPNKDTTLIRC